ncbi:copper amine oxidase N-terminal domain-containing protein [Brevibacillus ginsengisoli]|uniref:copper amine oxidase N-terminal domain-containing protein n=1 Tax=Brevibacillus ginsengisoli TaxID=363854 RepID=UPI003CF6C629
MNRTNMKLIIFVFLFTTLFFMNLEFSTPNQVLAYDIKKHGTSKYANGDTYEGDVCYSDILKEFSPCGDYGQILNPEGQIIYEGFFEEFSSGTPHPRYVKDVYKTITGITVYGTQSRALMAPIRDLADALGFTVEKWDPKTQEVTIKKDYTTLVYRLNSDVVKINGNEFCDWTTVRLINSKIYVPVEYLLSTELHLYIHAYQTEKSFVIHPYFGREEDIIEITTIEGKKIVINNDLMTSKKLRDLTLARLKAEEQKQKQPKPTKTK